MYCRKCRNAIPDDLVICPKCHFDNAKQANNNKLEESIPKNYKEPKKSDGKIIRKIATLLISVIFIAIGSLLLYETLTKAEPDINTPTTTYFTFRVDDLEFKVPSTYGTSTNTIFYKTNTDINISITEIDVKVYNEKIKNNQVSDASLNKIKTKTYSETNANTHLFKHNDKYYELKINYIDDAEIYNDKVRNEIIDIINSIK